MAFKTFSPGVLTSSDMNTFLMRQTVITCTAATRPTSPNEGMTIYETDTDLYKTYSGTAWEDGFKSGAWITYTPSVLSRGSGTDWALGNGTITGRYQRVGRLIVGEVVCRFGSTSTFGTKDLVLSGPVSYTVSGFIGDAIAATSCFDDSVGSVRMGATLQIGPPTTGTTSTLRPEIFFVTGSQITTSTITSSSPFTWATNDYLSMEFIYEAAQ